jgi:hypothetical protein
VSSDEGWRLRGHVESETPVVALWARAYFFHLELRFRGLLVLHGGPLVMSPRPHEVCGDWRSQGAHG